MINYNPPPPLGSALNQENFLEAGQAMLLKHCVIIFVSGHPKSTTGGIFACLWFVLFCPAKCSPSVLKVFHRLWTRIILQPILIGSTTNRNRTTLVINTTIVGHCTFLSDGPILSHPPTAAAILCPFQSYFRTILWNIMVALLWPAPLSVESSWLKFLVLQNVYNIYQRGDDAHPWASHSYFPPYSLWCFCPGVSAGYQPQISTPWTLPLLIVRAAAACSLYSKAPYCCITFYTAFSLLKFLGTSNHLCRIWCLLTTVLALWWEKS